MAVQDNEEKQLKSAALQNAHSILQARLRAEEELRKQSTWLRVTLSSIGDAVISTDAQGRVTFMNVVAESLTGWSQAEATGLPLASVFCIVNEDSREPVENPALRALREGTIVGLANHTILIARDGTERPIDDSAAPIRFDDGAIGGAVLVFRDITERHRAHGAIRESAQRFRQMADAAPVLIWLSDSEKQRPWFNKQRLDFVGRPLEREIGIGWVENVHPHDLDRCLQTYADTFDARQVFLLEYRLRRHDGSYRWLLANGRPAMNSMAASPATSARAWTSRSARGSSRRSQRARPVPSDSDGCTRRS
ncbi:MAG: PAS domain S-box protein [Phycisphaerae bacterium]|nr:PAS domain S-box protein [Phycisphaerae bacterium]